MAYANREHAKHIICFHELNNSRLTTTTCLID